MPAHDDRPPAAPPLCARIRAAREQLGLTQEEAAHLLKLSHGAYRAYEKYREPRPYRLRHIAAAFGVPEDHFFLTAAAPKMPATDWVRMGERIERMEARLEALARPTSPF